MRKFWSLIWVFVIVAVVISNAEVASDTAMTDTLGSGNVVEQGEVLGGDGDFLGGDFVAGENGSGVLTEGDLNLEGGTDTDENISGNGSGENESAEFEAGSESEIKKTYFVSNIVDGDTIDVIINNENVRIRLIGVDTPEIYGGKECFGREAAAAIADVILGEFVLLESDETQGEKDKYDRLLRYVFTAGGENVAEKLIRGGFGVEYTYKKDYRYKESFLRAEAEARESKSGMWAEDSCVVGEY